MWKRGLCLFTFSTSTKKEDDGDQGAMTERKTEGSWISLSLASSDGRPSSAIAVALLPFIISTQTLSQRGAGKKGGRHHRVRDRGVAGPGALDEEKKSNRFIRRFKRLEDVAGETTPHFRLPLKTFVSLQTQHLRHCADRSSLSSPKLDAGKPNNSGSSSSWIRQWS
ncbi:hypothetical protein MRB53_012742 [Persea americana]|uniref:Uncharacterized protein n=1 Tax=Persea americana TaxID=3435 RepID=A0ACC2LYK4_PERAE|nr:hypothetical protein MRB53_012742 [Persea americana]